MKTLHKIGLGIITAAAITAGVVITQKKVQPQSFFTYSSTWITIKPGGYWNYPLKGGDTFYMKGSGYTYFSGENINGDSLHPIVIIGDSVTMSQGFNFTSASYIKIFGMRNDSSITIKNAPGTALSFTGKGTHDIEIAHVKVDTADYFVWFKEDPDPCDTSTWYPNCVLYNFKLHDCIFNFAHQDGVYVCNTDQEEGRIFTCNGKTITNVPPAGVANIQIWNLKIRNTQRTAIQVSGCRTGLNFIDSCDIANCGFEFLLTGDSSALHQGVGIALGGNDINFFVRKNKIRNTLLNNISSFAYGNVVIRGNDCDSADYVWGFINPQKNAAVMIAPQQPVAQLTIVNNKTGWSNNQVGLVIYNSGNAIVKTGNTVKGNTGIFPNFFVNNTGINF